ncbi:MAG: hypothetical protein R3F61_22305 [Myxococcota bacterium]
MVLLLLACVDGRDPVVLPTTFTGSPASFALDSGTVTLERAELVAADLRLEAPPVVAWFPSLVASARAHPGHEFAGSVRGELLGEWSLDLVGGDQVLGAGQGWEGDVATARFDAHGLILVGTWSGPDGDVPFDIALDVDRSIVGIDALLTLDASRPDGLALGVDLPHALGFVEWDDTDGDGTLTEADGTLANTVVFGITSSTTWALAPASETP